MDKIEWIAPCHFGLESVLKREVEQLGYEIVQVEDGRVTFRGGAEAVCRANIFLRTAERVLMKVGSFQAKTFDELFEKTKELPWENYIPKDGKFWVAKAASVKSKLFSPSDIQSIMKKAMVERLRGKYGIKWFEETGASYPVRVFLMKDTVTVGPGGGKSADRRESGSGAYYAHSVEKRPDSRRSVLRKRYVSDRGGDDRSQHCSGNEPIVYG